MMHFEKDCNFCIWHGGQNTRVTVTLARPRLYEYTVNDSTFNEESIKAQHLIFDKE